MSVETWSWVIVGVTCLCLAVADIAMTQRMAHMQQRVTMLENRLARLDKRRNTQ